MIPISYSGFGPAAILIMVLCLVVSQVYKHFRDKGHRASEQNDKIV